MSKTAGTVFNRRHALLLAGASLVSACGSIQLLPSPMQPQLYVLRPQTMPPMGAPVRWRLSVGAPDAPASLDTARIEALSTQNASASFPIANIPTIC